MNLNEEIIIQEMLTIIIYLSINKLTLYQKDI